MSYGASSPSAPSGSAVADRAYALSLAPAARRMLTEGPPRGLPLTAALVAGDFITGPLLDRPWLVGKPLARELAGYYSARRGSYRIVYRIDDEAGLVHVVRIDHRANVYYS